jgi:hypothetical protein
MKIVYTLILSFVSLLAIAGDTTNIPLGRQVFHDNIKSEQRRADLMDGKADGWLHVSAADDINLQVTDAIIRRVNFIRNDIESSTTLATNNDKIRYLRFVENLVKKFVSNWKTRKIVPTMAPRLVDNFEKIMKAHMRGESMDEYILEADYEVALINHQIFKDNKGYEASKKHIFFKHARLNPDKIMTSIKPYVNEPFADSLVLTAFQYSPTQLYTYAQAENSVEGKLILRNPDNRIKVLVELSKLKQGLLYFPFLDDLISGKQKIEDISKLIGTKETSYDSVGYFKLLVKTQVDYFSRVIRKDTPVAMYGTDGLTDMLRRKAIQHFITPINELHDISNPAVRFRSIESLTPRELYYMIVMGEDEIFTSSYKYSFDKMLQRMGKTAHGDSLLMSVNFDHFKKFIKMAAGYNTLDIFLGTMNRSSSETLMKAFVANLESQKSLEDAVDVADSYGSIRNKELLATILNYVKENEKRCINKGNLRGQRIYSLLKTIFLSADSTNKIDIAKEIGIPPVYTVDYNYLANDSGRVIQQVFFYGDKDGKESFQSYMTSFPAPDWKQTRTKDWVEIKSMKGKPITIYANLPLDNESDKDAEAQAKLIEYLDEKNLRPSIVIHRGHSYHLQYTIEQLPESAKIIMLGSCGGYKNLSQILEYCPEAHIISTKQIGARDVNKPIIDAMNNTIRAGKTIDWRKMWASLEAAFAKAPRDKRDLFEDYIPPHKNLGALFIKAYNREN